MQVWFTNSIHSRIRETAMNDTRRYIFPLATVLLALAILVTSPAGAGTNEDLGILPVDRQLFGKSYGDWGAAWWQWAVGIPAASNPVLDPTGEFGHIDQHGPVWFLAGAFGGTVERSVTVPKGKWLFFPLFNTLWWAPEDLEFAAFVAQEFFGLDPNDLTDEELIRLVAAFALEGLKSLRCTIDGVRVQNPEQYRASSSAFMITDTDLLDDFEIPISMPNLSISDGYWIMLAPLPPGEHVITFSVRANNPLLGRFKLDVTYHLTVK